MQIKNILPVVLATAASAQSLTEILAMNNASLSTLAGLIQSNPTLNESLSTARNITILAPSNEAFSTFLNASSAAPSTDVVAALLSYHVLNGTYPSSSVTNTSTIIPTLLNNSTYTNVTGGQVVSAITNGSEVVITSGGLNHSRIGPMDLTFDGGVVHVIDKVLSIPANVSATAVAANLTGIASALTNASLVATVDGLSDVTIFAPSNAAFRSIGNILANTSAEDLATILTYHVVQGTVGYSSILTNSTLTTVNGGNVTITVTDDGVFVNSARVAIPDVLVSNGVVHVIDAVLNPSAPTATPNPTTTTAAFPGATSAPATTSSGNAAPMQTGAVGMAMLFGAGGVAALMV